MGAIKESKIPGAMPDKMPKGVVKKRRDNTDFTQFKEGGPVGLYANIHAKQKRIAAIELAGMDLSIDFKPSETTIKPGKGDSQKITLSMIQAGKTIEEIAKTREMTVGTIESHLVELCISKQLDTAFFINPFEIEEIKNAMLSIGEQTTLKNIHAELNGAYSYAKIKLALSLIENQSKP